VKNLPQIIDAMRMVGMVVGNERSIKMRNARPQKLLTQVRPSIDQQLGALMLYKDRNASPAIARV
jgi:hypothetical protein